LVWYLEGFPLFIHSLWVDTCAATVGALRFYAPLILVILDFFSHRAPAGFANNGSATEISGSVLRFYCDGLCDNGVLNTTVGEGKGEWMADATGYKIVCPAMEIYTPYIVNNALLNSNINAFVD
jgi:hypothetical protein